MRPCALKLDRSGFVLTGAAVPGAAPGKPALEASLPGRLRDRRRARGIGQARRRRDRRGRGGGRRDPRRAGGRRRGLSDGLRKSRRPPRHAAGAGAAGAHRRAARRGVVLQPYRGYGSAERIFVIGRAFWQRTDRAPGRGGAPRHPAPHPPPAGARRAHPRALLRRRARGRDRPRRLFPHRDGAGRAGAAPTGSGTGSSSRCWRPARVAAAAEVYIPPPRRGSSWSPTSTTR